jgi:TRAP-type C4-dicarboxylate transport system substrate-binding protein
VIQRLGGTPVSLNPQDIYEAVQRGTVDGAMISWSSFGPYKLQEVTKYHVEMQLGTTTSFIFMSRKKYEGLSAAARKAIDDNSGEAQSRTFGKFLDNQAATMRSPLTSTHQIVTLTGDQRARWSERIAPVVDEWAKGRNGGDKALQSFRTIYEDIKAGR